jgi:hypothetical protein
MRSTAITNTKGLDATRFAQELRCRHYALQFMRMREST